MKEGQRMESQALSVIDNVELQQIGATLAKIAQFQAVVRSALKQGHDYGVIPGTEKPTLYKPGAEKVFMLLGLTSEYELTEKIQDYDRGFFAFTVKCLVHKGNLKITEGLGHANTREARYARRWASEKDIPEGIDKATLKTRERDGRYGKYTQYLIENLDTYTLVNTVLKMAKKRSQVDAALTVASLSDIFTQDVEDLPGIGGDGPPPAASQGGEDGITDKQLKKVHAMAGERGLTEDELHKLFQDRYGVESGHDLTKRQASDLIDYLATLKPKAKADKAPMFPGVA